MGSGSDQIFEFRDTFHHLFNRHFAQMALLDLDGTLVAVNRAWRHFGDGNGICESYDCIGKNYLQICESALLTDSPGAKSVYLGLLEVIHAGRPKFTMVYPCHSLVERRWYRLWIEPQMPAVPAIIVAHYLLPQTQGIGAGGDIELIGKLSTVGNQCMNPGLMPDRTESRIERI